MLVREDQLPELPTKTYLRTLGQPPPHLPSGLAALLGWHGLESLRYKRCLSLGWEEVWAKCFLACGDQLKRELQLNGSLRIFCPTLREVLDSSSQWAGSMGGRGLGPVTSLYNVLCCLLLGNTWRGVTGKAQKAFCVPGTCEELGWPFSCTILTIFQGSQRDYPRYGN